MRSSAYRNGNMMSVQGDQLQPGLGFFVFTVSDPESIVQDVLTPCDSGFDTSYQTVNVY